MDNRRSFKLATIHGVDLKLHVSLLILLFYVIFIAAMQFPLVVKQAGLDADALRGGPMQWGVIFAMALLVSVALHEFGHVLMAQRLGVKVRGITLMMLGGVSEMEEMPEKPYAEFKLSVIGPVVSFAIAGLLYLVRGATQIPELILFSSWLSTLNLALGIFNLLPAFPLDGGRALRSILAARRGKLHGTELAVAISKALAWAFGIIGLLSFNFLLMLIGFFVYSAANNELFLLTSRNLLQGLLAGDVGIKTESVAPGEMIASVANHMIASRKAVLPVDTSADAPAVIRLTAFRKIPRGQWSTTRIETVMERVQKALRADESVAENLAVLASTPAGALPLMGTDNRLIGLVRTADVLELMQFRSMGREPEKPRRAA